MACQLKIRVKTVTLFLRRLFITRLKRGLIHNRCLINMFSMSEPRFWEPDKFPTPGWWSFYPRNCLEWELPPTFTALLPSFNFWNMHRSSLRIFSEPHFPYLFSNKVSEIAFWRTAQFCLWRDCWQMIIVLQHWDQGYSVAKKWSFSELFHPEVSFSL